MGSNQRPRSYQDRALLAEFSYSPKYGGAGGGRTHYLFNAIEALSQLSYSPSLYGPRIGTRRAERASVNARNNIAKDGPRPQ